MPEPGGFQFLGLDPVNPKTLYGLDYPNTLITSKNSGASWSKLGALSPTFQGYGRTLVVDPTNSANLYAGTDEGIFVSTNQGSSWTQDNDGLLNTAVTTLASDARSPGTFYAGTESSGIFKTTNSGNSWTLLYPDWGDKPLSLQVNPKTSTTLYYSSTFIDGVFTSTNGGTTWTNLLPSTIVFSLSVNPKNPAFLYAGGGNVPVFLSKNGGTSWAQLTNGLSGVSPNSIASSGADALLADPNTGVYFSKTNGTSWANITPAGADGINTALMFSYTAGKEIRTGRGVLFGKRLAWLFPR